MIHIAGPFFNTAQRELVAAIEEVMKKYDIQFFSPMRSQIVDPGGKNAHEVFAYDIEMMETCSSALAIIDWRTDPGQTVRIWNEKEQYVASPPLNIPDPGTMFEIGYYYARQKPIRLFTTRSKEETVNVMITQAAEGVVYGLKHLDNWLGGTAEPGLWTGGSQ